MSGRDGDVAKLGRRDRLLKEHVHDPYMPRGKLAEPTICPVCGVVYRQGRWQWHANSSSNDAHRELCPACQRIRDKVPAGYLTLSGEFLQQHRDEIMRLVYNKEREQNAQHPLKRLMGVQDQDNGSVLLTFTDMHLPRGVGEAIERAYEGELDIQYTSEANIVRVFWRR